jgi:hypothetical protein
MELELNVPGDNLMLTLTHDELLSRLAFNFNPGRYTTEGNTTTDDTLEFVGELRRETRPRKYPRRVHSQLRPQELQVLSRRVVKGRGGAPSAARGKPRSTSAGRA